MIGGTKRMCEEFVLSNGLRVVAEPIENFPSVSVGLWIGAVIATILFIFKPSS